MKQLNTMKYIMACSEQYTKTIISIKNADSIDQAKKIANYLIGYLDGMRTFMNCMVCKENNEFTGDLGAQIDDYQAGIYQALLNKHFDQKMELDEESIVKWFRLRDEYMGEARAQWEEA